jgi:hypothetical protein
MPSYGAFLGAWTLGPAPDKSSPNTKEPHAL